MLLPFCPEVADEILTPNRYRMACGAGTLQLDHDSEALVNGVSALIKEILENSPSSVEVTARR